MGASAERTDGKISRGQIVAGRYRLETLLARGGMGSVWIARHQQLDSLVAIKFMDTSYAASTEARSRFEREAKAAALLKSPNVVTVHDYGVEGEQPFLVMELLQGEDLGARLRREKRLSLSASVSIVGQAAKALRRAHEAGIIHRDMKPRNVFLARADDDEVVKILDFGVAKIAGLGKIGDGTQTGMLIGSPHYMSPEQARRAREVDARSDLWSLGVIAYRCITGELPFPGDEVGDVIVKICTEPVPSVREHDPKLPSSLDNFFKKALARSPKDRFQNARELATSLIGALGDRDSYPPGAPIASLPSGLPSAIDSGSFPVVELEPAAQSYPSGIQPAAQSHPSMAQPAAQSHPSMNQPAAQSHPSAAEPAAQSHPSMNQPAAQSHPSVDQPAAQSHPSMNQPAAQSFSGVIVAPTAQDAVETKRPPPVPPRRPIVEAPAPPTQREAALDPPSAAGAAVLQAPIAKAKSSPSRGMFIGAALAAIVLGVGAVATFTRSTTTSTPEAPKIAETNVAPPQQAAAPVEAPTVAEVATTDAKAVPPSAAPSASAAPTATATAAPSASAPTKKAVPPGPVSPGPAKKQNAILGI